MAGKLVTAAEIHETAGMVALNLKVMFQAALDLNEYLLAHTDQELIAMGMTAPDVTLVKAALADLSYMHDTAFDSSASVKKLWGLGR
jgi:hypothetical protein